MIEAQYYYFIYWFVVMLMTVSKCNVIKNCYAFSVIKKQDNYGPILLFLCFYILFYSFRPITGYYFGDTLNYYNTYTYMEDHGVSPQNGDAKIGDAGDWLFYYVMFQFSQVVDVYVWFFFIMILYIVPMFVGCKKFDTRHGATIMLFCLGAFSFYTYSVNGIRNGMACSLVILALALLNKGNKVWPIVLSLIAINCHKSTALPVVSMFFVYYVRKPQLMYITWIGAIAISLMFGNYIDNMMSLVSYDDRLAGNIQGDTADDIIMEHRFRWDFLLYSSMPILLGWYTIFKRKLQDKTYLLLLGTYIYANSFWVLAIRGMFSNRIAYLSWFIYPIVLAYPLLNLPVFKKNHSQKTAWILLGHFGFTTILWLLGK